MATFQYRWPVSFSNSGDHQHHWRSIISREPLGLCDQCLTGTLESVEGMIDREFGLYHLQGVVGMPTWMPPHPHLPHRPPPFPQHAELTSASVAFTPACLFRQQQSSRHNDLLTVVVSTHVMIVSSRSPKAVSHLHGFPLLADVLRGSCSRLCANGGKHTTVKQQPSSPAHTFRGFKGPPEVNTHMVARLVSG